MGITTEYKERTEAIKELVWEIAGGVFIFIMCFFFWALAVAFSG